MKPFVRLEEPAFLAEHAQRWNRQWTQKKTRNNSAVFLWYKHHNQQVNHLLLPILKGQTQEHCSYCDAFPLRLGDQTIDHFCPKGNPSFYHLAYQWSNLYFACAHCQMAKREQFSVLMLRPDDISYSFERFFVYNYNLHELEPNPAASYSDQQHAEETIKIFKFNHPDMKIGRRHSFERWVNYLDNERFLEDFSFRFMLF
ncbi:MAG: hypothetical protein ACOYNO_06720 [Saprospiraceae bacterium]